MSSLTEQCPRVIMLQCDCFEHQVHLILLSGLEILDAMLKSCGYDSSVAKTTNVLRERAQDFCKVWSGIFTDKVKAKKKQMRMFPKCCSGRWGSVHEVEFRMMEAGGDNIHKFLNLVLTHRLHKLGDEEIDGAVCHIDIQALEQQAAYRRTMGRWHRDVLHVTKKSSFRSMMEMLYALREPLLHLSFILKKPVDEPTIATHGNQLQQLANGKAKLLALEFEAAAQGDQWRARVTSLMLEDHRDAVFFCKCAFRILLSSAAGIYRRVVLPLQEFPFKLLQLARNPSHADCFCRRRTASDLLGAHDRGVLDVSTKKFLNLYRESVQCAEDTGKCPSRVHRALETLGRAWQAHVRENERLNKQIGIVCDRAPNSTLELVSSRLQLEHYLGRALDPAPRHGKNARAAGQSRAFHEYALDIASGSFGAA
ncbi:unnamed protein product [Prorocentrum cordatum]|uniref:Uncharacterized protein n=1 Tax=Prorocentrum cordatum TaxID=2364126 RepID=A0ABN9SNJ3_9DINO|nr:unnamed protein product [Polarella glacialis]